MSSTISKLYAEEGELWLRVSPGHAISEWWVREQTPELYARWWAAPNTTVRDELALQIEQRLEEREPSTTQTRDAERRQQQTAPPAMADRVARYEDDARRLGMIALGDPARPATHLAYQVAGDALRAELAAMPAHRTNELLKRRLDAADLLADRPVIEAISEMTVDVDRLAAALADPYVPTQTARAEAVRAAMVAEDPQAALRADVLSAVATAGHDPAVLRGLVERRGVDLPRIAPALLPASDFYARHMLAIEAHLDRELTAGEFDDLRAYMASWSWGRPTTTSLHATEQAIVEHVVGAVIVAADDAGSDVREAYRMWERAADRDDLHRWSAVRDPGERGPGLDLLDGCEQQFQPQADDDVDVERCVEQEVR